MGSLIKLKDGRHLLQTDSKDFPNVSFALTVRNNIYLLIDKEGCFTGDAFTHDELPRYFPKDYNIKLILKALSI